MHISRHWLQKFFDDELPQTSALCDALSFHAFEVEGIKQVGDDEVLDVKVTPNRGHDCLSHRGIAKELSAILNIPLTKDPFAQKPDLSKVSSKVSVVIDTPLCSRYIAGYIRGVKVGPSPQWLRARLEAIGQRSINNIIDATNFVMFNLGQPIHAFDANKISGKITVRHLTKGDQLDLLKTTKEIKGGVVAGWSRTVVQLEEHGSIAISDDTGPIALAGIKGGEKTGINSQTVDLIVEAANFDGVAIRKSTQFLNLRTDASQRFEQVISPELAAYGMQSVTELILKLAGGTLEGFVDVYPEPQEQTHAAVSLSHINRVLGMELTGADVAQTFTRLGLPYKEEGGFFEVVVPLERLDLAREEDLVEEVARMVGYERVPAVPLPSTPVAPDINANFYWSEKVRSELQGLGYSEVYTSVFAEEGERLVANKVDSVRPYLRTSLVGGLNAALLKNIPNKDLLGLSEIKLFEIGTVWKGGKEVLMAGIVTEQQSAMEEPLTEHMKTTPIQYDELSLPGALQYQPFSRYPYIVRDVALWVPSDVLEEAVLRTIKGQAGELLVHTKLFDRFEKAGRVSLAFRLVFQSFERTLTEVEVHAIMEKVYQALRDQGFEIR